MIVMSLEENEDIPRYLNDPYIHETFELFSRKSHIKNCSKVETRRMVGETENADIKTKWHLTFCEAWLFLESKAKKTTNTCI